MTSQNFSSKFGSLEILNVLCDLLGHPRFLAHLTIWTGRRGEAFSQVRSDAVAACIHVDRSTG